MEQTTTQPPTLAYVRGYRDQILALSHEYGVSNIRVFGSVARGEATHGSDIDLLVKQDWTQLKAWGGMGFVIALEDLLHCRVDVTTEDELKPALRQRIRQEAIPL